MPGKFLKHGHGVAGRLGGFFGVAASQSTRGLLRPLRGPVHARAGQFRQLINTLHDPSDVVGFIYDVALEVLDLLTVHLTGPSAATFFIRLWRAVSRLWLAVTCGGGTFLALRSLLTFLASLILLIGLLPVPLGGGIGQFDATERLVDDLLLRGELP